MSTLMSTLGIDRLSTEDRLRLVDEIWESLEEEPSAPPLTDPQRQELERRLAKLLANRSAVSTWDEVEARIMRAEKA